MLVSMPVFEENNKSIQPRIKDFIYALFSTLNKIQVKFGIKLVFNSKIVN